MLLARQEALLVMAKERFVNQALQPFFPHRTLEAIKGQRRKGTHKDKVAEFVGELAQSDSPTQDPPASNEQREVRSDLVDKIRDVLSKCPPLEKGEYCSGQLNRLIENIGTWDHLTLIAETSAYLRSVFPAPPNRRMIQSAKPRPRELTRRERRRQQYALTQRTWKRNPCKCLRAILKDKETSTTPDQQVMSPFWCAVMTSDGDSSPGVGEVRATIDSLWRPVNPAEIKLALPEMTTSPGPDGITARQLRAMPRGILVRIFNIFLLCGKMPKWLLESRTILIPKKENATEPGEFRPITVSSVITRTFHRILANRLSRAISLDPRQKAFVPVDGCAENAFLLDMVLRHHRQAFKPLYLASIDIAKAFDSVTHNTISDTMKTMGVPDPMVSYINYVYENSLTILACDGWTSHQIHPKRGVKQGDPLSPMLFNMVIDRMLQRIPAGIGVDVAGKHYSAMAFADDLIMVASTPQGLQLTLDKCAEFLQHCGLMINVNKSFTVAVRNVPHVKKTVVDSAIRFQCLGRAMPALRRQDEWRYLGVPFTPEGRTIAKPEEQISVALDKLTKAPLKPQQRMFALRVMVLPSLYHILTLGATNLSRLKKIDTLVRRAVRRWLALPLDVATAYFHAKARDGGLSIPAMRWLMPLRRKERLEAMANDHMDPRSFLSQEIQKSKRRLKCGREDLDCVEGIEKWWAKRLHESIDGGALKEAGKIPQQNRWVMEGTKFLSGRDYVNCIKLRINALPTKSRTSRGRYADRHCRAGCNDIETLNHVLQKCHRTHGARISRHNAVASYVHRALQMKCDLVEEEPHLKTPLGLRKPDLVAIKGTTALVVDAQVVSEQTDLNLAHERKKRYYQDSAHRTLLERYPAVTDVKYTSATLSWRGIWSQGSAEELVKLGVLKSDELKIVATRTLIGGLNAFRIFNSTTSTRRRGTPRTGIG